MVANRNEELAKTVLPELEAISKDVAFTRMDAGNHDDVKAAFQATVDKFGTADIVVANAGFSCQPWIGEVEKGEDDEWMRGVNGNLVGTMLLGRVATT